MLFHELLVIHFLRTDILYIIGENFPGGMIKHFQIYWNLNANDCSVLKRGVAD